MTVPASMAGEVPRRRSGEGFDGPLSDASAETTAILETHGVNRAACMAVSHQLKTRCRRALGAASRVGQRAEAAAQRWFHGISFCRDVFVEPSLARGTARSAKGRWNTSVARIERPCAA